MQQQPEHQTPHDRQPRMVRTSHLVTPRLSTSHAHHTASHEMRPNATKSHLVTRSQTKSQTSHTKSHLVTRDATKSHEVTANATKFEHSHTRPHKVTPSHAKCDEMRRYLRHIRPKMASIFPIATRGHPDEDSGFIYYEMPRENA